MANKMLIDASHPEETRVVVLRGNRVEEFDFESASKKQLRGNIYLAKVTRVEPSLQAAFVDYGGNRHGFLAFSEIHPDYYQIPVVDRQALIEEEAKAQRDEEDEESRGQRRSRRFRRGDRNNGRNVEKRRGDDETLSEAYQDESGRLSVTPIELANEASQKSVEGIVPTFEPLDPNDSGSTDETLRLDTQTPAIGDKNPSVGSPVNVLADVSIDLVEDAVGFVAKEAVDQDFAGGQDFANSEGFANVENAAEDLASIRDMSSHQGELHQDGAARPGNQTSFSENDVLENGVALKEDTEDRSPDHRHVDADDEKEDEEEQVEQLGGDAMEEVPMRPHRYRKQYKIQEVIKRRQVLLVQVVKEERGNKGAALTTYLSLAGRYSVLMPNTARGGGISRKITDSTDRQRLKSIAQELEVPEGMGVILRTAGAARTKAEVKRDFEYLLRMWETVRETTLQSTAPTLVYEEGSLIKRSIRDLYNKDIDEIVVAGENGYREAKEFMRLLMPSHVRNVQPYRDPQPVFAKSGVEAQLDAMFSNQVTLKSGGYIVINQTEALVAIDVNSGRSTREHNIEDTALRTNLEATDEIARQLRLRDLAGLIVLDLIDMEESRNNRAVERRLKEALKNDRARIQVGRISHFGLLEMSRQRMRTGVLEGSTVVCPHCSGAGMLRSTSSIALHILRIVEDALIKSSTYDLIVNTSTVVALYILNQKRPHLRELERRFGVSVTIGADDSLIGGTYYVLERGELAAGGTETLAQIEAPRYADDDTDSTFPAEVEEGPAETEQGDDLPDEIIERQEGESESEAEGRRRRRRRRRRGRGGDREASGIAAGAPQPPDDALEAIARIGEMQPPPMTAEIEPETESAPAPIQTEAESLAPPERRRTRRGGRVSRDVEQASKIEPESNSALEPMLDLTPEPEASKSKLEEEAGSEIIAASQPRRSRRAPRARSPRRAGSVSVVEFEDAAVEAKEAGAAVAATEDLVAAPETNVLGEKAAASMSNAEVAMQEAPLPTLAHGNDLIEKNFSHANETSQPAPSLATSQPSEQDPTRPKRSGWWQRAKASLRE